MNRTVRNRLKKIIELTAYIDPKDKSVWGHDTDLGKVDDILEEAHKIIRPLLKVID